MGASWIEYKGKKIWYIDFSNTKNIQETIDVIEVCENMHKTISEEIYILSNYRNAYISNEGLQRLKKVAKKYSSHTKKTATIGIDSNVKKLLFKGYLLFTGDKSVRIFDNEIDAKEWLIENR
ncbi:MAG: hypothetical protein HQK49_12205 [Oligoflexia bacterium]|nr:hypothetical protein [Oligoflexia bacterium]